MLLKVSMFSLVDGEGGGVVVTLSTSSGMEHQEYGA